VEFHRALAIDRALEVLAGFGSRARLLAGGTYVMMQLARGDSAPEALIALDGLRNELGGVSREGDGIRIGALTTLRELTEHPLLNPRYRSIARAAASIGGWQTQSVATVGGNVCSGSPGADLLAPLLVHGAVVTLRSARRGERRLALSQFLGGPGQTTREPDELVTALSLDPASEASTDVYLKVGRRSAMEIAIAGLAARLGFDAGGQAVMDARLATCSVGPIPRRATEAEHLLVGPLAPDRLARAGEALARETTRGDDVRASARYRRALLPRLLLRAVRECRAALARA